MIIRTDFRTSIEYLNLFPRSFDELSTNGNNSFVTFLILPFSKMAGLILVAALRFDRRD